MAYKFLPNLLQWSNNLVQMTFRYCWIWKWTSHNLWPLISAGVSIDLDIPEIGSSFGNNLSRKGLIIWPVSIVKMFFELLLRSAKYHTNLKKILIINTKLLFPGSCISYRVLVNSWLAANLPYLLSPMKVVLKITFLKYFCQHQRKSENCYRIYLR